MAVKQLYVSKSMETFWARGEIKAKRTGVSFAEYVGRLIRSDIMAGGRKDPTLDDALADLRLAADTVARLSKPDPVDDPA
jgi:hypothetical protein